MSIRSLVIAKLAPKIRAETVWADVTGAVANASAAQKQAILKAVQRNAYEEVGKRICTLFGAVVQTRIEAEADTILADEALSKTELTRLLG